MKKFISIKPLRLLVAFLFLSPILGRTQNANNSIFFQAIAKDKMANPAKDRKIFVQTNILQTSPSGNSVLTELHETNTDGSGVFSINIGQGLKIAGTAFNLSGIKWSDGPYFINLKIAITPTAPIPNWDYKNEFIDIGTSPFGSVPYAFYAENVTGLDNKLNIADTAAMLSKFAKSLNTIIKPSANYNSDSLIIILNKKLNIVDSITSYVTPTQLKAKTFDTLSMSNRIDSKLNISDSLSILRSYVKHPQFDNALSLKLSKTDTALMLSNRFARDTVSLSNRINLKENTSNKSIDLNADGNLDSKYPSAKAVKTYVDASINNLGIINIPNASIADADTVTKGKIKLAGDLYGTADLPIIANNAISTIKIADGAITNNKIASGINPNKVGLGNVDNTSDINKPISTATQNALSAKLNINDTSTMLSSYSNKIQALQNTKLNITDTSAMLLGYNNNIQNLRSGKLNLSDTSIMLTNRIQKDTSFLLQKNDTIYLSNRINLKLNLVDTSNMLSKRIGKDTLALSSRINQKLNIADTSSMLSNYLSSINTKELLSNKSNDTTLGGVNPSISLYPTQFAVQKYVYNNVVNGAATGTSTTTVLDATTSIKGKIQLAGDLGGTASSPKVLSIGGVSKDSLAAALNSINAATSNNIVNYIVRRSPIGDFSGSTITATTGFVGNLTGNVTGNASNVSGIVAIANGGTGTSTVAGFKTNFGLENIDNTSDINKPVSTLTQNALNAKLNNSAIAVANGVASLGADGKVPTSQLPAFSISTVNAVNSQSNMLALSGLSVGAVAIRTDNANNYILTALPASTLANWQVFYPASTNVQSVNGLTGSVALTGTSNRLTISGSNVFDIANSYIGQTSINTLGTITMGAWNGSVIPVAYGGTGQSTASNAFNALAPSQTGNSGKFLTTNGTTTSWSNIGVVGGWGTTGNSGTVDGTNFLGTTDAQPLNFQIGGIASGRIDVSSTIGQATLGYGAGANTVRSTTAANYYGTKNTAIGFQASYNTNYGKENTALGYQALLNNFTGSGSTAIGFQAMSNSYNYNTANYDATTYSTAIGYQALQGSATPSNNTGRANTALGYQALKNFTSGDGNAANGYISLFNNTTGSYNTASGHLSLYSNTTGDNNTNIGIEANYQNTTGANNTSIGAYSLQSNITGNSNTAIGYAADITGNVSNATAIGANAIASTSNTIQLGDGSVTKVNTGGAIVSTNTTNATSTTTGALVITGGAGIAKNTFIGANLNVSGTFTQTGAATFSTGITASGTSTNTLNNLTVQNTSILGGATNIVGITNISNATTSSATTNGALIVSGGTGIGGNLYVGGNTNITGATTLNSISYGTTPSTNDNSTKLATTAYVMSTLASPANGFYWSTTGNSNMTDGSKFFGTTDAQPLNFQVGGTASGRLDVSSTIGQTTLGYSAGANTVRNTTTLYGTKNTALGYQASNNTNYGKENTALGYQALLNNFTGSGSTAIGFQAMSNINNYNAANYDATTYNTAIGYQALQGSATPSNNTGRTNTASGYQALKNFTSGEGNAANGYISLFNNTTGSFNTASGHLSLYSNTTGDNNTNIGAYANYQNTSGTNNTSIGVFSLQSNLTGSSNTAIGYYADITGNVSNSTVIGNGATISTANSIQLGNTSVTLVNTSATVSAKHLKGNSTTPTIAASTGAGTTPTGVTVTGTDMSGVLALTTGTAPAASAVLATITYNLAYSTAPVVVITPANAATASLMAAQAVWVNIGTSNFTINTNATSLSASTAYKWNYVVIQ